MLRWVNRKPFARWVHVRAGAVEERWPWRVACVQSSVRPVTSNASSYYDSRIKLSTSNPSKRKSNRLECVVRRQLAHGYGSAAGDAEISAHKAGMLDVHPQFCDADVKGSMCSLYDSNGQTVDDETNSAAYMPSAKMRASIDDVRVAESAEAMNDDTVRMPSSELHEKFMPGDVTTASCATPSPHVSLQSLVPLLRKHMRKELSDLRQKVELLEAEGLSVTHATILLKRKRFISCSYEQLKTMLQVLKLHFHSAEVVHRILVGCTGILVEPVELVQRKLKILYDCKLEETALHRLCGAGEVLSMNAENLRKKLMFYEDIGMSVAARNEMFSRAPDILSLSIERRIHPAMKYLESIGLTKERVLQFGRRCPEVFYMSLDNNLIKRYEYFRDLGYSADKFSRVFRYVSRISIKKIEEHLQGLKDVGFSDEDVAFMVRKQPSLFGISCENVKSKVKFLVHEQNRKMEEIVKHPISLLYSLQGRLAPRFNIVNGSEKFEGYCLSTILDPSDSRFMEWSEKRGCAHLENSEERGRSVGAADHLYVSDDILDADYKQLRFCHSMVFDSERAFEQALELSYRANLHGWCKLAQGHDVPGPPLKRA